MTNILKSVSSNQTLTARTPKYSLFVSSWGKKEKKYVKPGFVPTISTSEVDRANHDNIGSFYKIHKSIYVRYIAIYCNETKSESWPVKIFGVRTAGV